MNKALVSVFCSFHIYPTQQLILSLTYDLLPYLHSHSLAAVPYTVFTALVSLSRLKISFSLILNHSFV